MLQRGRTTQLTIFSFSRWALSLSFPFIHLWKYGNVRRYICIAKFYLFIHIFQFCNVLLTALETIKTKQIIFVLLRYIFRFCNVLLTAMEKIKTHKIYLLSYFPVLQYFLPSNRNNQSIANLINCALKTSKKLFLRFHNRTHNLGRGVWV